MYKVGQWYNIGTRLYLLALVNGESGCCFISPKDGHRWTNPVKVSDRTRITDAEFGKMCGSYCKQVRLRAETWKDL